MNADPALNQTGIVAVAIAVLGPLAGELAVIVFSALAGSLWALSRSSTDTRRAGALLVLRLVLTHADWRHHPPAGALRDEWAGMVPLRADGGQDDRR